MENRFFKNVTYMSFGTLFKFLIGFISTAIFIRTIGTEGYAIMGIVFSLFGIISGFDISYFLGLVNYNSDTLGKEKKLYKNIFNTLYNSILFSNIFFFIILFPIMMYLSHYMYQNPNLMIFYILALVTFFLARMINFLKYFIRANRQEAAIQKANILSLILEFVITIIFLFIFKFGVLSIFLGSFIARILEFSLLNYFTKRLVKYKLYFSFNLLVKVFKENVFQENLSIILFGLIIWGGLFVSTFYLDKTSIGILTIFVSLNLKLRLLYGPFRFHLVPIYSYAINKENYTKIKNIMHNLTPLFIILFATFMVFFLTIGKHLYLLYFGSQMGGTYFMFLLMISGMLFWISFSPQQRYIFISNIRLHTKILALAALFFFILLFPLINYAGLIGVVITYFVIYLTIPIIFLNYSNRILKIKLIKDDFKYLIIASIFLIINLIVYSKDILLPPFFSILLFIIIMILLILIINVRKSIKRFKFIASL